MNEIRKLIEAAKEEAIRRINLAIEEHAPTHVFALFSGGHDSLTTTALVHKSNLFSGAVHIDTGTGIKATREFVERTCLRESWPLLIYEALQNTDAKGNFDPQDYRAMVRRYGFPGPAGHGMMYARLKERAIRRLCRDHKETRKSRIMLVAGCRSAESVRRMGHVAPVARDGCKVWVNPIHDWSKRDCGEFIAIEGLERNLVCGLIHRSGECNCGAFAQKGELEEMIAWFPEMGWIKELEAEVASKHPWKWGERPPKRTMPKHKVGILCSGCGKRWTNSKS